MDLPHPSPRRHFRRSRSQQALLIVLPVLLVAFLAIIVGQQYRLERALDANAELVESMEQLQAQNAFYKHAYEITLDDIRVLSKAYDDEGRYLRLAAELRAKEIGTVVSELSSEERYLLRNPGLWNEYRRSGVVNVSCLNLTDVDTIAEDVFLDLKLNGTDNVSVYIDGNFLTTLLPEVVRLSVRIPNGEHELDLVSRSGGVRVERVAFDTAVVPLDAIVADRGVAWTVFDCHDAEPGTLLIQPGAFRLQFQKH